MQEASGLPIHATIVVAVAENGTIGRDNQLPWKLRSDLHRFKQQTMGHALIMGRKTFQSIGRVLPGRTSIVLSRSGNFTHPGVQVVRDIDQALNSLPPTVHPFVVGGSEIYRQMLPIVDRIMLTRVLADISGDAKLESWDRHGWHMSYQQYVPQSLHDEWPTTFEIWERVRAMYDVDLQCRQ